MSINRGMDKEDMVHIHIVEYYSTIKKKGIMPFAATWMDLESVILSEVSQKKKNKTPIQYINVCIRNLERW